MAEKSEQPPTAAELEILQVLWQRGPSTVREVMDHLNEDRQPGYTTVLKFLQIMFTKGLVKRDESVKTHVYEAATPAGKMQKKLVGNLMEKVFSGSVSQLVMHALGSKKVSRDEVNEIRKLLDSIEKGDKPS